METKELLSEPSLNVDFDPLLVETEELLTITKCRLPVPPMEAKKLLTIPKFRLPISPLETKVTEKIGRVSKGDFSDYGAGVL